MSDKKKRIPKWLSSRLFAIRVIFYSMAGFVLHFTTGIFQSSYWTMHILIEWMDSGKLRLTDIEYDYLNESLKFIFDILGNFKILIMGNKDD